ncbi:DUF3888 domain-containing protein [Filobacillus milosensis]|uniref:DUF3888 domain-containing protein n=1 Tax=Filobacillus milosensis TaxID=94137 RepID=A0A4Y8IK19_9BACI|nr:DUF3888 domain-containing protein [Filobacillus milosensis]TFB21340.1 DUF3888 domain-containing protein [Filobacillus milosensis]
MKKMIGSLLVVSLLSFGTIQAETNKVHEAIVIELLTPTIEEAIEKFYGMTRQYDQEELVEIKSPKECDSCYEAVIDIRTYIGAQEPPYGMDRLVLDIRGGDVTVIDYQHEEVKK